MAILFLDFEASSLRSDSHPIEVGWFTDDGQGSSHLISHEVGWRDWSVASETLHGITRDQLAAEGISAADVARSVNRAIIGNRVWSDAPAWDREWCARLFSVAGLPVPVIGDTVELYAQKFHRLRDIMPPDQVRSMAMMIVEQAEREAAAAEPIRHRALPDARRLWRVWLSVKNQVAEAMGSVGD